LGIIGRWDPQEEPDELRFVLEFSEPADRKNMKQSVFTRQHAMKSVLLILSIIAVVTLLSVVVAAGASGTQPNGLVLGLKSHRTNTLTRLVNGPTLPMKGNLTYWGEYYVSIGLGTPPQQMKVAVSTGTGFFRFFRFERPLLFPLDYWLSPTSFLSQFEDGYRSFIVS
jgi:hypothetical protein